MSCHGCSKSFNFFTKEFGCPSCGFGYCKNCLDNSAFVQKLNQTVKVCFRCKASENNPSSSAASFEPPKAYLKMLESLANQSKPPITIYNADPQQFKGTLSEADKNIANRLEALKADRIPENIPSESEIRERLARLREEPTTSSSSSNLPAPDTRSDQQKSDDLIKQYMSQCKIDDDVRETGNAVDRDIEERLNKLRDQPTSSSAAPVAKPIVLPPQNENEDEESQVARVIQQALAMDVDDDGFSDDGSVDSEESFSDDSEKLTDSDR